MYDSDLKEHTLTDLENKQLVIVEEIVLLADEGFVPDKKQYIKLNWSSILLHLFENIDVFSDQQQRNIDSLYGKISAL